MPVFTDGVTPLNAATLNQLQDKGEKAAANGYASLGSDGKVPAAQLPAAVTGIPLPVVNGQWIKGVGGAAVWSAIGDADLPGRLGPGNASIPPPGNNCNNAVQNGWYYCVNGRDTNGPTLPGGAGPMLVMVGSDNVRQVVWDYNSNISFTRYANGSLGTGPWSAWVSSTFSSTLVGGGWTAGWADYGSSYGTCRYRKSLDGLVKIEGMAYRSGAAFSDITIHVMFTLPAGYRPNESLVFPGWANATAGYACGWVQVDANGDVSYVTPGLSTGSWVSLSAVSFYADQ